MMSIHPLLLALFILTSNSNFYAAESFTTSTLLSRNWSTATARYDASQPDPESIFESIYDIDEKYSQEEALKSGIRLTKVMRQVQVDHEEEIKRLNDEIDRLIQKRAYTKLACWCLDKYITLGELGSKINDGEYEKTVDMDSFDYDLMNACLAKYGMKCTDVEYGGYRDDGYFLHCSLHDENADIDEEV
eukprot:scaffold3225_cov72-Skeletonema_dohrnii-CCMP3373.AAC.1